MIREPRKGVGESQGLVADYRSIFGKKPGTIAAAALLVGGGDTGLQATAWFDDIVVNLEFE